MSIAINPPFGPNKLEQSCSAAAQIVYETKYIYIMLICVLLTHRIGTNEVSVHVEVSDVNVS